jgi:hypothetical protein
MSKKTRMDSLGTDSLIHTCGACYNELRRG